MKISRKELSQQYHITKYSWEKRHDEIIAHLQDFMDITEIKSDTNRYTYEIEGEMPESIPPLPKKSELEQKKKDYELYTIKALGTEFKPNSKSKIAREAIRDFGQDKYGHKSPRSVVESYIKEPFDKYGVSDGNKYWCYYNTYEVLEPEVLEAWRKILKEEHISEREAANAFYRQQQGEDISKEKQYYQNALDRFKAEYGSMPVVVSKWKCENH